MITTEMKQDVLAALVQDSRCPVADIAARIGATPEEVAQTIQELEDQKIVLKYTTLVDWSKARSGYVYAFIDVSANPQHGEGFDGVADYIARFDEVHSLYLMSGVHDLLVVVEGRDFRDIATFVSEKLACLDQVRNTSTSFVLKAYKRDGLLVRPEPEDERLAVTP